MDLNGFERFMVNGIMDSENAFFFNEVLRIFIHYVSEMFYLQNVRLS